jgi:hypothetical protein
MFKSTAPQRKFRWGVHDSIPGGCLRPWEKIHF